MENPEIIEVDVVEADPTAVDRKKLVKNIAIIAGTTIALHVVAFAINKRMTRTTPEIPSV